MKQSDTALENKRIVVTRAVCQQDSLCQQLTAKGADSIGIPLIEFRSLHRPESARTHLGKLADYDWIIFSSSNAIRFFRDLMGAAEIPKEVRLACVGRHSADTLEKFFRQPDFIPQKFSSRYLADEIDVVAGQKVLYPCPVETVSELVETLEKKGAEVERWPIYETNQSTLTPQQESQLRSQPDAVTFASPSVVNSFCEQLPDHSDLLRDCLVACIGPMTKQRAVECGLRVDIVPEEYSIPGLVKALETHWAQQEGLDVNE